jgi:hypothetical protein
MGIRTEQDLGYYRVISDKGRLPCVRICGSVAWGNADSTDEMARRHVVAIGAEHKNGSLILLNVYPEGWMGLSKRLRELKDEAWCIQWWVDPSAEGRFRELRRIDGLTYFSKEKHPEDRPEGHIAVLASWWQSFSNDVEGARTLVEQLTKDSTAHMNTSPAIIKAMAASKPDQIQTATSMAIISLIWHLYQTSSARRGEPQKAYGFPWEGDN